MATRSRSRVPVAPFVVALAVSLSPATTISVPPPMEMIARSDLIVEGRLMVRGEKVEVEIESVLKGSAGKRKKLELLSERSVLDFSLSRVAARRGRATVVVLGRLGERTGTLILPWLDASIWPRETNAAVAAPPTLESARALVAGSARLTTLAENGPEALVADLVSGLDDPDRRVLVLEFLESRLDEFVKEREMRHALFLVIGGQLAEGRPMDAPTVEGTAVVSPMLPPSAALGYLMEAARSEDPLIAKRAYSSARAVLLGRRLIQPDEAREIEDIAAMEAIVARELPGLRVEDAERALALFDSPVREVRSRASDTVAGILGEPRPHSAPSVPEAARAYWAAKIRSAAAEGNR